MHSQSKQYQALVDDYHKAHAFLKRLQKSGMLIQISIMMGINGAKYLDIGSYYNIVASVLFPLSIYFLWKDLWTAYKIEGAVVRVILNGIELEKKRVVNDDYFQGVLHSFNLIRILAERCIINVAALGCLGYLFHEFLRRILPGVSIGQWFVWIFAGVPSLVAVKLYFDVLRPLHKAKNTALAR